MADLPLGAWENDRQKIRATPLGDRGDVSDLPEHTKFIVHVARIVRRRELNSAAEYDGPAAFVLVDTEQYHTFKGTHTEERLIHTGGRRLTGRIHFVTSSSMGSVIEEFGTDDNAMFQRIAALNASQLPTLVYVPQKPFSSVSYYPHGTQVDEGVVNVPLDAQEIAAEQIEEVVDSVHSHELVTPDNSGPYKIWSDAGKGKPIQVAERFVQQLLRIGLATKFPWCSIRQEQPAKVGRTDLEIVDDRTGLPGQITHHAVLELKVLRSRGETGVAVTEIDTQQHITDGVNQAYAYGKDKNTKLGMLCCFDMRDNDEGDHKTFEHIDAVAQKLAVLLRRWFLYRSSESYRAAQAAAAVGTTP